jgi:hypothetical protein
MSIFHRIRWSRVCAAGVAVVLFSWFVADEPLTAHHSGEQPLIADGVSEGLSSHAELNGEQEAMKPGTDTLLVNRPWVDHMPRSERDMVTQLVFLDKDGKKFGAMLRASRWRQLAELFRWETRNSSSVTVEFPQNNKSLAVSTRVWACKDAPKGFDLCLQVSLLGKGVRLYSNKKWSLDTFDASALLSIDPDAINESLLDEAIFAELSAE